MIGGARNIHIAINDIGKQIYNCCDYARTAGRARNDIRATVFKNEGRSHGTQWSFASSNRVAFGAN